MNGVLEQGKGAQDDILMTVMLWRLDTGDIAGALEDCPLCPEVRSDHAG